MKDHRAQILPSSLLGMRHAAASATSSASYVATTPFQCLSRLQF
jgi:hypothetical protein